jgi:hypothetical protein
MEKESFFKIMIVAIEKALDNESNNPLVNPYDYIEDPSMLMELENFELKNPRYSKFYESIWNYFNVEKEYFDGFEEFKEVLLKQIQDYKIIYKL